jgi:hypothetical protein
VACHAGTAARPARLELADILRSHAPPLATLTADRARVVRALVSCRTAALGGHLQRCDNCGREVPSYNSCRNRHCPKCQSLKAAVWVESRCADLLPVHYFHQVFTAPECLRPLFLALPRVAHPLLLTAAAETLLELSRTNLGATPGFIAMLHTWTQTLEHHPHVHCIITGGGLSLDGQAWVRCRPRFFLPVRKLSQVFRGKLLDKLATAFRREPLASRWPAGMLLVRQAARRRRWVVYCKAPLAGPEQVLRYLGRYTHRIAIGNERLIDLRDGQVTFSAKDRARQRRLVLRLPAEEFVRRFLLHALPRGLVRVRHYGLLANGVKTRRLDLCRRLLDAPCDPKPTPAETPSWADTYRRFAGRDPLLCPHCGRGRLVVVAELRPTPPRPPAVYPKPRPPPPP